MSGAYEPAAWNGFAIATAGAAAALAGLLVVAMSINIHEILANAALTARAAGALATLATPLIVSLLLLVPTGAIDAIALCLLAVAVAVTAPPVPLHPAQPARCPPHDAHVVRRLRSAGDLDVRPAVPRRVRPAHLDDRGPLLLAVVVVVAFVWGLVQAWVLLIEILR